MRLRWPWAPREHYHPSELSSKLRRCKGCGHLLRTGHVDNVKVEEEIHAHGSRATRTLTYGPGCAPSYRRVIIAEDGTRKELP